MDGAWMGIPMKLVESTERPTPVESSKQVEVNRKTHDCGVQLNLK